jgi:hypothetical protein
MTKKKNIIPEEIPTDKYLNSNIDYTTFSDPISEPSTKYVYSKVETTSIPIEDSEEDEIISPYSRRRTAIIPEEKDFKHLIEYLLSKNSGSLLKFLLKNGLLREGSNCMVYNPELAGDMENSCKFSSKMLYSEIKQYVSRYNSNPSKSSILLDPDFYINLCSLLREIYLLKSKSKLFILVDTLEAFKEVVTTCVNKGIKIELDLLENKCDFLELRKEGKVFKMAFFGNVNELILVKDDENQSIESLYYFHKCLRDLPDIIQQNNNQEEMIEIEGKKYSKSAFVSMIECDFDSFIMNLDFESSMTNIKNATKEIKEKELL